MSTKPKVLHMTEDQLLAAVLDAAKQLGYRVCHFRPARTATGWRTAIQGDKGWVDLVLCGYGRFMVVECKSETGKLTDDQGAWRWELLNAGIEYHVWRPRHWFDGTVARILEERD